MPSFGPETFDRIAQALPRHRDDGLDEARRSAAVLIPLYFDGEVRIVLTKRSSTVRTHRGEVSFPGGGWEPSDASLEVTALREAHEEIGLHADDVEVLGVGDDMPTAVSGFVIRPFVARIPHPYTFRPDPREVERVLRPRLADFTDPSRRREQTWEREGVRFPMTFYEVEGEIVWGATARILVTFLDRLAGREPDPVRIPPPRPAPR